MSATRRAPAVSASWGELFDLLDVLVANLDHAGEIFDYDDAAHALAEWEGDWPTGAESAVLRAARDIAARHALRAIGHL